MYVLRRESTIRVHRSIKQRSSILDGSFKFKKIPHGVYTLSVFLARRGEIRRTINVGPSLADERGRVYVEIRPDRANIDTTALNFVSARELAVPEKARKEYAKGVQEAIETRRGRWHRSFRARSRDCSSFCGGLELSWDDCLPDEALRGRGEVLSSLPGKLIPKSTSRL